MPPPSHWPLPARLTCWPLVTAGFQYHISNGSATCQVAQSVESLPLFPPGDGCYLGVHGTHAPEISGHASLGDPSPEAPPGPAAAGLRRCPPHARPPRPGWELLCPLTCTLDNGEEVGEAQLWLWEAGQQVSGLSGGPCGAAGGDRGGGCWWGTATAFGGSWWSCKWQQWEEPQSTLRDLPTSEIPGHWVASPGPGHCHCRQWVHVQGSAREGL